MVKLYWSADALFWQLSIDHEMDLAYQIAEVKAAWIGWPVWAPCCATLSYVYTSLRAICRWSWWPWENECMGSIGFCSIISGAPHGSCGAPLIILQQPPICRMGSKQSRCSAYSRISIELQKATMQLYNSMEGDSEIEVECRHHW